MIHTILRKNIVTAYDMSEALGDTLLHNDTPFLAIPSQGLQHFALDPPIAFYGLCLRWQSTTRSSDESSGGHQCYSFHSTKKDPKTIKPHRQGSTTSHIKYYHHSFSKINTA